MITPPLACTVRGCGLYLERRGRTFHCARRHSYDVSHAGYVNLLQPQDRKSLAAGDKRETIDARARLLASGVGRSMVERIVDRATRLLARDAVVADLGSGSGDLLAMAVENAAALGVGIDLSVAAAEHAARRFPALTWVVANADRGLPLLDGSVDLVLSINGRRSPAESARALARGGHLLVAVPAPDDLIELRTVAQGKGVARDRTAAVVTEHEKKFSVVDRFTCREQHLLARDALRDLLRGTYRGERRAAADALDDVDALTVTLAADVVVFAR